MPVRSRRRMSRVAGFAVRFAVLLWTTAAVSGPDRPGLSPATRDNMKLADQYYHRHQYLAAIPCYKELLAVTPPETHAQLRRKLATCYVQSGYLRKAIDAWKAVLEANPDDSGARTAIAGLHFRLGEVDEGLAAARTGDDPVRILKTARDLLRYRHLAHAEELARTIVDSHPQTQALLGEILFEQRKLDEALVELKQAFAKTSQHGQWPGIARKLAELQAALGSVPSAIQRRELELATALKKKDKSDAARLLLLLTELKQINGDHTGAVRSLIKWREIAPENPRALFALRKLAPGAVRRLLHAARHEEAQALVKELVARVGRESWVDCIRCAVLFELEDEAKAGRLLRKLKADADTNEAKLHRLCEELIACGLDHEAMEICKLILESSPHKTVYDSNAHAMLGGWHAHKERWAEADKHFRAVHAGLGHGMHMIGEKYFRHAEVQARYHAAGKDAKVLVALLGDPDPVRRLAAVELLGAHGAEPHLPVLRALLDDAAPPLKAALREAATNIRTRLADAPVRTDAAAKGRPSEKLMGLGELEWVKRDPIQSGLRWVLPKKGFVAALDTERDVLTEFPDVLEALGLEGARATVIAFTEQSVWLGTSRGLLLFDRTTGEWSAFAVGGKHLGSPVRRLAAEGGRIVVTLQLADGVAVYAFDPRTRRWQALRS